MDVARVRWDCVEWRGSKLRRNHSHNCSKAVPTRAERVEL